MTKKSFIESFNSDACIDCGICIKECRFRQTGSVKPAYIFMAIKDGTSSDVFSGCLSCMKCNHICPKQAFPASLFLQKKHDSRANANPFNPSIRYALNGKTDENWIKNIFTDAYSRMNRKDRKILERWNEPKASSDLLFCGCASRLDPGIIENSQALTGLDKFGGPNDCCGIFALKAGLFEESREIAHNLIKRLERCSFERLVFVCSSCQEMFTVTMPRVLGIEVPFKTISIYEYIYEKILDGSLIIQKKHSLHAVISDSCSGCELGRHYLDCVRMLMKMTGIETEECVNNGNDITCCGLPAFLERGSIIDALRARSIRIKELKSCGAKNVISCCQGCSITFDLPFAGFTTSYFLDLLLISLGDIIKRPNIVMKFLNISSVKTFIKLLPWLFRIKKSIETYGS